MCAHSTSKKTLFSLPVFTIFMVLLGIFTGLSRISFLEGLAAVSASVFIHLFKCLSLPIISLSLIVTLSKPRPQGFPSLWRQVLSYTFGTTFIAALLSALLYLLIRPSLMIEQTVVLQNSLHLGGYLDYLSTLLPSSLFSPFLEQQVIGVLLISLAVGIALRFIPDPSAKETLILFFRGAHGLLMVMTRWVINLLPIGMFGFIATTLVQARSGVELKGLLEYLLVIVLANLIQGIVILPLWLKWRGLNPIKVFKGMLPALSLAFFSKSSVGTLPLTIETAEKSLKVNPEVSRFVLPLCTSLNMNGCAAFIFTTVMYLMQNHGIELSLPLMSIWLFIATVAAIGNAGVPMGCFFLSTSLLVGMNVPITLMGLILPFYSLIDMLETALNVWSDACITKVVDENLLQNSQAAVLLSSNLEN